MIQQAFIDMENMFDLLTEELEVWMEIWENTKRLRPNWGYTGWETSARLLANASENMAGECKTGLGKWNYV